MSFAMPANRIRWYPRRMYAELRDYVMRENTKYAAKACGEFLVTLLHIPTFLHSQRKKENNPTAT